jgi:hypothetical protein
MLTKLQKGGNLKSTAFLITVCIVLLLWFPMISVLGSSPGSKPDESPKHVTVGMIALLADPERYSGIRIRTFGFLSLEFEGNALYFHEEDYKSGLGKNALELNLTQEQEKQFKTLNLKYVIIEGTVVSTRASVERGLSGGALGKITRVELWQPRAPLRDPRSK